MRNLVSIICVALLVLSCCRTRPEGRDRPVLTAVDRDNGLVLRLSVAKKTYQPGDTISATATLENTTAEPLAVHYLDISPMYLNGDSEDALIDSQEMSVDWRYAYYDPIVLRDLSGLTLPVGTLIPVLPSGNSKETKEACMSYLDSATFGDFYPSFVIPARSTITTTQSFKASSDRDYVDVGLFCLKSYYSKAVLAASGLGADPDEGAYTHGVKLRPKIWIGSLYVHIKLDVE